MARTNAQEVQSILGAEDDPNVATQIETAAALVDAQLAGRPQLTETLLRQIEAWLAAHFYSHTNQKYNIGGEVLGDSNVSYNAKTGVNTGLMNSRFGQTAISLDPTGTLKRLGEKSFRIKVL